MSVKRTLKLDAVKKDNPCDATPLKTRMKNLNSYSPTTGTRQMSPSSSPMSHNEQYLASHPPNAWRSASERLNPHRMPRLFNSSILGENPNQPKYKMMGDGAERTDSESGLPRRGQPQAEEKAFMELQSKVKHSLVRILKIRANLTSLQALEGSRELEDIIGVSDASCPLSAEMQKTQVLMSQAAELLQRNHEELPAREDIQTGSSSVFLKSLLD